MTDTEALDAILRALNLPADLPRDGIPRAAQLQIEALRQAARSSVTSPSEIPVPDHLQGVLQNWTGAVAAALGYLQQAASAGPPPDPQTLRRACDDLYRLLLLRCPYPAESAAE